MEIDMSKRKIEQYLQDIDGTFNGDLDRVIDTLQSFKVTYSNYTKFRVEYYHHWDTVNIRLHGTREETDEEYKKRLEIAYKRNENTKKEQQKRESRERKEYERLKKKYG
jgi:hypothetical protein